MKALCRQGEGGGGRPLLAARRGAVSGSDLTPNCFSSEDDQGHLCEREAGWGGGHSANKVKRLSSRGFIRLTRLLC